MNSTTSIGFTCTNASQYGAMRECPMDVHPFTMTRMINAFSQRRSHETLVMKVIYWEAASQWHIYHRFHLLTFGCPNLLLHLTDRFLDGQRAYYTPCQIPSRRSESVRYSIVKRWLAAVFRTHLPSGTVVLKFEYYREYFRINFAQSRRYFDGSVQQFLNRL